MDMVSNDPQKEGGQEHNIDHSKLLPKVPFVEV